MLSAEPEDQRRRVCGCGPSPSSDGADTLGQGRIGPAAGHPFAQLWWAWSGALATRGVNQEGDHAEGVRQNGDRARVASGVLTLVYYGLRDGHIRALDRPRAA